VAPASALGVQPGGHEQAADREEHEPDADANGDHSLPHAFVLPGVAGPESLTDERRESGNG